MSFRSDQITGEYPYTILKTEAKNGTFISMGFNLNISEEKKQFFNTLENSIKDKNTSKITIENIL